MDKEPICIPGNAMLTMPGNTSQIEKGQSYICHRHEIWDKEKTIWFGCSDSNWDFGGNAGGCADELWHLLCTCAVVVPPKE